MQVAEKFISLNGEGKKAGEASVFIRFKGCNLSCDYCDTGWVNQPDCEYEEMDIDALTEFVLSSGIKNVTLTGGEPLLQKDMTEFIELLCDTYGKSVEIETNGSINIANFAKIHNCSITMDYKLPSSGCENMMREENFWYLRRYDVVKFVIGSEEDLQRAVDIVKDKTLDNKCHIYFSPVHGKMDPAVIGERILDNKLNGVRLQLQLHKIIGMR